MLDEVEGLCGDANTRTERRWQVKKNAAMIMKVHSHLCENDEHLAAKLRQEPGKLSACETLPRRLYDLTNPLAIAGWQHFNCGIDMPNHFRGLIAENAIKHIVVRSNPFKSTTIISAKADIRRSGFLV